MDNNWCIQQRLCRLMLLQKSLTGEEVARQIVSTISTEFSISLSCVIAAARDRASVNDVAMCTISIIYSGLIDIGCFCHTLGHVGEHVNTPNLDSFFKAWVSLFSHSPKARLLWRTQLHHPIQALGGGVCLKYSNNCMIHLEMQSPFSAMKNCQRLLYQK